MKRIGFMFIFFLCISGPASEKKIIASKARIILPMKGVGVTAGYGEIKNNSKKAVNLSVLSSIFFKAVELHRTSMKDGMMSMERVDSIVIEAGESFKLTPGGYHIMLFEPVKTLGLDQRVILKFLVNKKPKDFFFTVTPRKKSRGPAE